MGKDRVGIGDSVKSMPKPGTERAVVDCATDLEQQIGAPLRPSHLLRLVHASVRLHEKGGKRHEMPAHHNLEAYLDAYVTAAGIRDDGRGPLFRSAIERTGELTVKAMNRVDAYRMIQRRAAELGMRIKVGCHTFRATGITAYLEAGGTLENAQAMAAHESPRTTKLYDRTGDEITLDEVERITI